MIRTSCETSTGQYLPFSGKEIACERLKGATVEDCLVLTGRQICYHKFSLQAFLRPINMMRIYNTFKHSKLGLDWVERWVTMVPSILAPAQIFWIEAKYILNTVLLGMSTWTLLWCFHILRTTTLNPSGFAWFEGWGFGLSFLSFAEGTASGCNSVFMEFKAFWSQLCWSLWLHTCRIFFLF